MCISFILTASKKVKSENVKVEVVFSNKDCI